MGRTKHSTQSPFLKVGFFHERKKCFTVECGSHAFLYWLPQEVVSTPWISSLCAKQIWLEIFWLGCLIGRLEVVQLLQWRIRPLWHVYERDKLLSWLQKKITITRLRVHTRQVIDKIIIAPCMCGVVNRTPFKIGTIPILRQHIFGLFGPHQSTLSA